MIKESKTSSRRPSARTGRCVLLKGYKMSMIGNLKKVTKEKLNEILDNPDILEEMIYPENDSYQETDDDLDIDKAWEGIYFLFNGCGFADIDNTTEPNNLIFLGGQVVDENQDFGYGPACYLTPEQVKVVNNALKEVSDAELTKRYNPEKMMELGLYPEIWEEQPAEGLEFLIETIQEMRNFYEKAASEGEAVITYMN
jgi:hypothetical protein